MMVEVTQEDREAAASVAVLAEMRELILSGRADHHAEPWAIHRQRGKLEGARLALEAAAREAAVERQPQKSFLDLNFPYDRGRLHAAAAIRALDPAKIVGEG